MRLQLALNVSDIEASVEYYEKLFGTSVAKRKPGYANFEISQPPLKLVLFESGETQNRLNHLGVEVSDAQVVAKAAADQEAAGLEVEHLSQERCCFAEQDKAVSYAPDGTMWEWYVKREDLDTFDGEPAKVPRCC